MPNVVTLESFVAQAKPVSDETWQFILNDGLHIPDGRNSVTEYEPGYIIHTYQGKWWVHAWWYTPRGHDTKESAETDLFAWSNEWRTSDAQERN